MGVTVTQTVTNAVVVASTASVTIPTVADGDWLLLFVTSPGTASAVISSTTSGSYTSSLTQIGSLLNVSGHTSTAWKTLLSASNSGQVITYTFAGALQHVISGVVVRGCDTTDCVDGFQSSISVAVSSSYQLPTLNTVAANAVELSTYSHGANNSAGLTTLTPPAPLTKVVQNQFSSALNGEPMNAIATNLSPIAAGSTIGGEIWTADATGTNAGWTLSLRPLIVVTSPVADAGPDQTTVEPWSTVQLDGSGSYFNGGSITSYAWTQISGPAVTLTDSGSVTPSFVPPGSITGDSFSFSLTVVAGGMSSQPDQVDIAVLPVTERAAIGGAEVPVHTTVVEDGSLQ